MVVAVKAVVVAVFIYQFKITFASNKLRSNPICIFVNDFLIIGQTVGILLQNKSVYLNV